MWNNGAPLAGWLDVETVFRGWYMMASGSKLEIVTAVANAGLGHEDVTSARRSVGEGEGLAHPGLRKYDRLAFGSLLIRNLR